MWSKTGLGFKTSIPWVNRVSSPSREEIDLKKRLKFPIDHSTHWIVIDVMLVGIIHHCLATWFFVSSSVSVSTLKCSITALTTYCLKRDMRHLQTINPAFSRHKADLIWFRENLWMLLIFFWKKIGQCGSSALETG